MVTSCSIKRSRAILSVGGERCRSRPLSAHMTLNEIAERLHKIISKIEGILLALVAKTQRGTKTAHHQLASHHGTEYCIAIVKPCIEAIIRTLLAAGEVLTKKMFPVVARGLSISVSITTRADPAFPTRKTK